MSTTIPAILYFFQDVLNPGKELPQTSCEVAHFLSTSGPPITDRLSGGQGRPAICHLPSLPQAPSGTCLDGRCVRGARESSPAAASSLDCALGAAGVLFQEAGRSQSPVLCLRPGASGIPPFPLRLSQHGAPRGEGYKKDHEPESGVVLHYVGYILSQ